MGKSVYTKEFFVEKGAEGGRARWRGKDPSSVRNKGMKITVSKDEYEMIKSKADYLAMSVTQFLVELADNADVKKYREV